MEAGSKDREAVPHVDNPPGGMQAAWTAVNFSTVPFWVAMIVAPRSGFTRRLMERVAPLHAVLSVVYSAALLTAVAKSDERIDFGKLASVSRAFQQPEAMLAGWTHYISFDLFVGSWIWRRSLAEGRSARIALLLTWWAGPAGLGLFAARNRVPAWLR